MRRKAPTLRELQILKDQCCRLGVLVRIERDPIEGYNLIVGDEIPVRRGTRSEILLFMKGVLTRLFSLSGNSEEENTYRPESYLRAVIKEMEDQLLRMKIKGLTKPEHLLKIREECFGVAVESLQEESVDSLHRYLRCLQERKGTH